MDKMNKDDLKIMNYLDGDESELNSELKQEADELRECIKLIKNETLESVPEEVDVQLQKRFDGLREKQARNNRIYTFVASIAALFILFYGFYPRVGNQVKIELDNSISDVQKLNYFHSLYDKSFNSEDIVALNHLLSSEENPNVKVIILDLIDQYSEENQIPADLLESLKSEDPPSVQMALLNILDDMEPGDYGKELQAFSKAEGLDVSIKEKVRALLDKASPSNLNN